MKPELRLLEHPGGIIPISDLRIQKAKQFAKFLQEVGPEVFASLRETRRNPTSDEEVVIFSVQVERPQKLTYDIRLEEVLAAVFNKEDNRQADMLALRADFPNAPHTNLTDVEFPRSLCLYGEPYAEVRLGWTPARFLARIRYWLAKTAAGTLHAEDQPLEPLIQPSRARLILPSNFSASDLDQKPRLLDIYLIDDQNGEYTLGAYWRDREKPLKIHSVAAAFSCQPQTHGVIRRQPNSLLELHDFCKEAGLNLAEKLAEKIQEWHVEKPAPEILQSRLVLILLLPKIRREGSRIESVDTTAFITGKSVEEVGVRLGVIQKHSGVAGYIIDAGTINLNDLAQIPVHLLQVYHRLSTARAAAMNGVDDFQEKILAIGMGALGSQIFNNLMRSGFGRWKVVDCEVLLPHNCARHLLGEWAVGRNKAEAMVELTNAIFYDSQVAEAIPADVLDPGPHKETFEKCYGCVDFVFDFSASIAVSRRLATTQSPARHLSAFMSPRGRTLVIAAEDSERTVRLDWLEMLHYRAVLNEPNLRDTLLVQDAYLRYGNVCSDVSGELAQDTTAIWAGVASRRIKQLVATSSPALHIYCSKPDGSTALFAQQVTALVSVRLDEWTIRLDSWLIAKIGSLRQAKLPNETGGILLGHFDTHHRICSLVDIVPSPSDSVEWPTSYIRGCAGLPAKVADAETHTIGRIGYVGEWHSHPRGATLQPSADDLEAYSWLITHMQKEALPAIMVIAGDDSQFRLVTDEHD